jgi:hypothetical protein
VNSAQLRDAVYDAVKSKDWTTADTLLSQGAPVSMYKGEGSTFFIAIDSQAPTALIDKMLTAPEIELVLNGTPDSWLPLWSALVNGDAALASKIVNHPKWTPFTKPPWVLQEFVLRDGCKYRKHPESPVLSDEEYRAIVDVVKYMFNKSESTSGVSYAAFCLENERERSKRLLWQDKVPEAGLTWESFQTLIQRLEPHISSERVEGAFRDLSVRGADGDKIIPKSAIIEIITDGEYEEHFNVVALIEECLALRNNSSTNSNGNSNMQLFL